jgi:hypothetical protein
MEGTAGIKNAASGLSESSNCWFKKEAFNVPRQS